MLNQEQIDFFHREGYLIMRGLITGRELEMLRDAVDVVQAEGVAHAGSGHLYYKNPDGSDTYWRSEQMWQRGDIFQSVTVHPDLLENIGQCVGQSFFPWNDSLVVKLASSGAPVPWHQDPPYKHAQRDSTYPVPNFTTDIYLDHSGPENGCVWAIHGHHLVGHVDLASRSEEELFDLAVPLEMEPGDVLFHCLSTPHGSRPNRSGRQRRIFYVHYLADEVYHDGYVKEPWAHKKPGWNEQRRALIDSMIDRRREMGWEDPTARPTLKRVEGGFDFIGQPKTPPRHWEELAAQIPPATRLAMKRLEKLTAVDTAQEAE
jgi:phytanoyl-CoA hydroxylase